jgi:ribosomal protein S18 acetylase RimI-like enzyme
VTARVCTDDDLPTVVDLLVDAFYEDPTWSWVFPDPGRRRDQQRLLWHALAEGAMRYGGVWLTGDATATAVWIPPGGNELTEDQETALIAALAATVGDLAPRVFGTLAAFERAHPHHEPHFTLSLLGTSTAHRGHGYGLALLEDTLATVDEAGRPAYLEASNPANVALYERYGFERFGTFALPEDGGDVTTMWRPTVSA